MTRSTTHLKRGVAAVAAASVAAAILVPSASAFWLGGGLQYTNAPTTDDLQSAPAKKDFETKQAIMRNAAG